MNVYECVYRCLHVYIRVCNYKHVGIPVILLVIVVNLSPIHTLSLSSAHHVSGWSFEKVFCVLIFTDMFMFVCVIRKEMNCYES